MYPEEENCYRLASSDEVVHIKAEIVPSPKHRLLLVSNIYTSLYPEVENSSS